VAHTVTIPESLRPIYPNPVQWCGTVPVTLFRDHRWSLPVIKLAVDAGLVRPPVTLVMLDRHRDALPTVDPDVLATYDPVGGSLKELVALVRDVCSPRDDDWVTAGMELGLVGDAVQFGHEDDEDTPPVPVVIYHDSASRKHRRFTLGRPVVELSYGGAMADSAHEAAEAGLWDVMGWDPAEQSIVSDGDLWFDIDLDYATVKWETYVLSYTRRMFAGEFLKGCSSRYYHGFRPAALFRRCIASAGGVSISSEPKWCGGPARAKRILGVMNRLLFGSMLDTDAMDVSPSPEYPTETG
jgi:hypothetical protein